MGYAKALKTAATAGALLVMLAGCAGGYYDRGGYWHGDRHYDHDRGYHHDGDRDRDGDRYHHDD